MRKFSPKSLEENAATLLTLLLDHKRDILVLAAQCCERLREAD
jgi:hypothetical protein